jgi:hypothetical protein
MRFRKQSGHTVEYSLLIALFGIVLAIILPIFSHRILEILLGIGLFIGYGFIFVVLPNWLPEDDIRRRSLLRLRIVVVALIFFSMLVFLWNMAV